MTTPVNVHTWEIDSNVLLANTASKFEGIQKACWNIKNLLIGNGNIVTNPWTVISSSDGNATWGAADYWTTADGTNLLTNAWVVLQRVDGFQMILQVGSDAIQYYSSLVISPSGSFAGGGVDTRPTAVDEIVIINNAIVWSNTNPPYGQVLNVQQSQDGLNTRIWCFRGGGVPVFFALESPTDTTGGVWTNPWVYLYHFEAGVTIANEYGDFYSATTWTKGDVNGTFGSFYVTTEAYGSTAVSNAAQQNQLSDEWPFGPMGLYCATAGVTGRHGKINDMWYGNTVTSNGDTYPSSTRDYIQVGDMILPWDGSNPLLSVS